MTHRRDSDCTTGAAHPHLDLAVMSLISSRVNDRVCREFWSMLPPASSHAMLADGERRRLAWRAASLHERMAVGSGAAPAAADTVDRLLANWRQTFAHGDEAALARRLAWEGWSTDDLARACRADGAGAPDGWTAWIDRVLAELPGAAAAVEKQPSIAARWDPAGDEPPFVEFWLPIQAAAERALVEETGPDPWFDWASDAARRLKGQLVRELAIWAAPALLEAFGAFDPESDGIDLPDEPDAKYRVFLTVMLAGGWKSVLFEHPVLARQLAVVLRSWVAGTAELISRLRSDRASLAATFAGGRELGPVIAADPALSDPHHGRRRVTALTFASGVRLVYKPHALVIDKGFGHFVEWLRVHGLTSGPPALTVLDRRDYGWVEFAVHAPLEAGGDARRFYRQAGALLCLAHVLRGRDLHQDNVVATAGGPVLIDLEMLFQPPRPSAAPDESSSPGAVQSIEDLAISTGLLSMYEAGADGAMFDVGGLAGSGAGSTTLSRRVWHGCRTDAIGSAAVSEFRSEPANAVRVGDTRVWPGEHSTEIVEGFTEAYRVLLGARDELLMTGGPLDAFRGAVTRVLPRPTNQYAMLSAVLGTPRYQKDGVRRSIAMDILLRPFSQSVARPPSWPVLVEERRALDNLDVPYFAAPVGGTDVLGEEGRLLQHYFPESGLEAVRARVAGLSESDLRLQIDHIVRALTESPRSTFAATLAAPAASSTKRDVHVAAACWIAEELVARGSRGSGGLRWDTGEAAGALDLYGGAAGPALFFAALAAVTDEPRWRDVADASLAPLLAAARDPVRLSALEERVGIGDGMGSLAYALVSIGRLLGRPDATDCAFQVAHRIDERIPHDRHFDVLSGSAGAILTALALDAIRPGAGSARLAFAARTHLERTCVETGPAEAAWPAPDGRHLIGFAHGAAGIAYALSRLHAHAGDERAGALAERARRFVQRQYAPADANWPIAAAADDQRSGAQVSMAAWCHGAPGVGLGLALARPDAGDASTAGQLQGALTTTARWIPGRADHLCCGTLGRVDALLTAGRALGVSPAIQAAYVLADHVLDRARGAGHFRLSTPGFDYRVFTPGFFRGLSGIGYQFLRLAEPGRLPSVLAFQ